MKTLILTLALALTSLTAANAQQNQQRQQMTPEQMAEARLQRMTERYSLTEEQQEKIKPILAKQPRMGFGGQRGQGQRTQRTDANSGATEQQNAQNAQRPQRQNFSTEQMDSIRKVMEANEAEIKAILTPEQLKKYEEDQAQMRQRMGGQGQRPQRQN